MLFAFFSSFRENSSPSTVAGDSAKTLSVLGNMGGFLNDCDLRFVQMWRRPLKIPPILGVQRIFRKITEKGPLPKSYQIDELTSQTLQSNVSYTHLPSALEIANLKRLRGAPQVAPKAPPARP